MVGPAEKVTAGSTVAEGLVAAGTVGPRSRVAARAVETAKVSGARGCGAVAATKVARLAEAGCRAAGATKVPRLAEAGCCAAGPTKVARLAEAGCCAAGATKVARLAEAGGFWAAGTGGGCREYDYVRPPRWLRRWSVSGTPGRRGTPHAPLRSASCLRSHRGWWRRCGPGWPASSVEEGEAVRVRQPSNLGLVGRRWFSQVGRQWFLLGQSSPPRRGGRPTASWPASHVPDCPRRVPSAVGGGGSVGGGMEGSR